MAKRYKRPSIFRFRNLIFLFLLLFLPLVVFVASNPQLYESRSKAVQLEGDGPDCSIDKILLQNYNITVTGVGSCARKGLVLNVVSRTYSYPGFRGKIGNDPIRLENRTSEANNWAYTSSSNTIKLNNFDQGNEEKWKFIITHELMHLVHLRKNIISQYPYSSLIKQDGNCFRNTSKGSVIKTYASPTPANAVHESFAESGALYILNKSPFSGNIGSFKSQCPNSFQWFKENIF